MMKRIRFFLLFAVTLLGELFYQFVTRCMQRQGLMLGANTLTNLTPLLYEALDVVSRELIGFIPAVSRDSSPERAALNQTINVYAVPAITAGDITPSSLPPDDGDATPTNRTLTISKSRYAPIRWSGEEEKLVGTSGMLQNVLRDQFAQAMRTLCNEVETDLGLLYKQASRAYGTAGATPFGTASDLSDAAQVRKILEDNGAPQSDLQMVLGTAAMANIRGKQSVLFKVNEAGTDALLRQGTIGLLEGMNLHSSAKVATNTKGTGASYTTNSAGYAVGATSITLITGSGTIVVGDTVTFAGDTNKYVVAAGIASPAAITLAAPGLLQAIPAAPTAVTVGNNAANNLVFSRSAMHLVTRAPAMPEGGDDADDVMEIQDPVSGLAFQVALYRQYRRRKLEVGLAWGTMASKPEHMAILLG
jgi:hypothetical protein